MVTLQHASTTPLAPLVAELEQTSTSYLEPSTFFVSWQGVLTLAYKCACQRGVGASVVLMSGFTSALTSLKQRIAATHPSLPPENPGSRWPKTSLGCLRDGKRLTPEQLAVLCQICREGSTVFQERQQQQPRGGEEPDGGIRLAIDSASVTLFECRSLERLLSCQHVAFQGAVDTAPPEAEERARVAQILVDAEAPDYWFAASRDGNREAHYRGTHLGATLMHPLELWGHNEAAGAAYAARPGLRARGMWELADRRALLAAIDGFRRRVDAQLPGMYAWFSDTSLHITLRTLIN